VYVDEAGCDYEAVGVDSLSADKAAIPAYGRYLSVLYAYFALVAGRAGAVNDYASDY
jgi:hypothetical protein